MHDLPNKSESRNPILKGIARAWRLITGISLTWWIMLSMVFGVVLGLVAPSFALAIKVTFSFCL